MCLGLGAQLRRVSPMPKNKREEITDLIDPAAYDDLDFKKGFVMRFTGATIKVTKIDRKNKRAWGEHINLVTQNIVETHDGHDVDHGKGAYDMFGMPFCKDCKVKIDEPSTEDGEKKALDRKDREQKEPQSA